MGTQGLAASQNKAASTSFVVNAGETIICRAHVQLGMAQNCIMLERELDVAAALGKLALIPMVVTEQEGHSNT